MSPPIPNVEDKCAFSHAVYEALGVLPIEVSIGHFTCELTGFLFVDGCRAGEDSIRELLERASNRGVAAALCDAKGRFLGSITDYATGERYIFVDNSGMYAAYYAGACVSPSFRQLALSIDPSGRHLSKRRIAEFIRYSFVFPPYTLIDGILRLGGDEVLVLNDGNATVEHKPLLPLDATLEDPTQKVRDHFQNLAIAIGDERIAVDLTGGLDSRLIVTYLDHFGTDFVCGLSAKEGYADAVAGRRVAEALGRKYTLVPPPEFADVNLDEMYRGTDATAGELETLVRKTALQDQRKTAGQHLALDGVGGELLKDSWWLHDFPNYRKRKAEHETVYRAHFQPPSLPSGVLTDKFAREAALADEEFRTRLSRMPGRRATDIYDHQYIMRMRLTVSLTNNAVGMLSRMDAYSPLLEYVVAHVAIQLPRTARMFGAFHRKEMSRLAPSVASLPTELGQPADTKLRSRIRAGIPAVTRNYAYRYAPKIKTSIKRMLNRDYSDKIAPGAPNAFAAYLRSTDGFSESLSVLKTAAIIDTAMVAKDIPDRYVSRLYVLGRFIGEFS